MLDLAPQAVTLRPYQVESIGSVQAARARGVQRGILVLATGLGKTTIAGELARRELDEGGTVLFMAHREELLDQAADRFRTMVPSAVVGIEGGSSWASVWSDIVVASVPTIGLQRSKRLDHFTPSLVVLDECHHACSDTNMHAARRFGCFDDGGAFYLGLTATAHRMDNKPLHGAEGAIYEEVLYNYPIKPAILDGWLCDIKAYRAIAGYSLDGVKKSGGDFNQGDLQRVANTDILNYEAFRYWQSVAADRPTICFTTGVEHAHAMSQLFNAAGYRAAAVDGTTPKDKRAALIAACKRGEIQVLCNFGICTEGFDWPEASCVFLLRPTQSWSLFVQMIGRGVRTHPLKDDCIVVDIIGEGGDSKVASVPAALGLPGGCRQNGSSMKRLMERLDDLPGWMMARLSAREFDASDLDNVLREVNLLAELDPPTEIVANSQYAWLRINAECYVISCGSCRERGYRREAMLSANPIGQWHLHLYETPPGIGMHKERVVHEHVADDLPDAVQRAESLMRIRWPGVGAIADREAPWRKGTAKSEKQIKYLKRGGLKDAEIAAMTAGQVSAFLEREFSKRRKR